jgi:hypothetical protein
MVLGTAPLKQDGVATRIHNNGRQLVVSKTLSVAVYPSSESGNRLVWSTLRNAQIEIQGNVNHNNGQNNNNNNERTGSNLMMAMAGSGSAPHSQTHMQSRQRLGSGFPGPGSLTGMSPPVLERMYMTTGSAAPAGALCGTGAPRPVRCSYALALVLAPELLDFVQAHYAIVEFRLAVLLRVLNNRVVHLLSRAGHGLLPEGSLQADAAFGQAVAVMVASLEALRGAPRVWEAGYPGWIGSPPSRARDSGGALAGFLCGVIEQWDGPKRGRLLTRVLTGLLSQNLEWVPGVIGEATLREMVGGAKTAPQAHWWHDMADDESLRDATVGDHQSDHQPESVKSSASPQASSISEHVRAMFGLRTSAHGGRPRVTRTVVVCRDARDRDAARSLVQFLSFFIRAEHLWSSSAAPPAAAAAPLTAPEAAEAPESLMQSLRGRLENFPAGQALLVPLAVRPQSASAPRPSHRLSGSLMAGLCGSYGGDFAVMAVPAQADLAASIAKDLKAYASWPICGVLASRSSCVVADLVATRCSMLTYSVVEDVVSERGPATRAVEASPLVGEMLQSFCRLHRLGIPERQCLAWLDDCLRGIFWRAVLVLRLLRRSSSQAAYSAAEIAKAAGGCHEEDVPLLKRIADSF